MATTFAARYFPVDRHILPLDGINNQASCRHERNWAHWDVQIDKKKEHFEILKASISPYRFYFLNSDVIRKIYVSPEVELAAEPNGEKET